MRRRWPRAITVLTLVAFLSLFVGMAVATGAGEARDHSSPRARHRQGPTLHRPRTQPPATPSEPETLVNDPTADTTNQDTQSETAIAVNGSNVSVVFNDSGSCLPNCLISGTHFTGYSVSTDGGTTFTDLGTLPESTEGDAGDPALATDDATGTLYLATLSFNLTQIQVFRSTDGGGTWSAPTDASPGSIKIDKPWIAVDNFAGPGQGTIYVAYANYPGGGIQIMVSHSTDGGLSFSTPVPLNAVSDEIWHWGSYLTVAPDHSVHVFYMDIPLVGTDTNTILHSFSTDGGISFSTPATVVTLSTQGFAGDLGLGGFSVNSLAHPLANPVNGDLLLFYNEVGAGSDRADVFMLQSTDGGVSWGSPVRVNDDAGTNDQWSPAVALTPDGSHLFVGFYDRRLDPANDLIDWFGTIGSISGHAVTFGPNFRISTESFPPVFDQDPVIRDDYMGDYDSAAADNSFFYTVWGDNRDGDTFFDNQPDVRFAKIVASGVDLALTKTGSPAFASVGEDVTYTLTVQQVGGPDVPTGVTVVDTLPAEVVFASATPSQGTCADSAGTVTCDLGTLSGGSAIVDITVTPIAPGSLSDSAEVSADQTDIDPSNNSATVTTQVSGTACTTVGTPGDDTLTGTMLGDVICGLGGDDELIGLEGDDVLLGGSGMDQLSGGNGQDVLNGQDDDDVLAGGNAKDVLVGGSGADTLSGGPGTDLLDTVDGVGGNDTANGGLGVDACQVDPGDVVISCP